MYSISNWILFLLLFIFFAILSYTLFHKCFTEWTVEGFDSGSGLDVNYAVLYGKVSYHRPFQERFAQLCREICPDRTARVLVIGTRSGHVQQELAKYYGKGEGEGELLGQDDSRSMLRELKENYPKLKTVLMDPREKNMEMRGQYDLIVCPDLYIYQFSLEDQQRIYEALYMYKKAVGYIVMPMFNVEELQTKPREHSSNYVDEQENVHAITYYDQFVYDTWFDIGEQGETWMEIVKKDLFEMENHEKKKLQTTKYYVERVESTMQDLDKIGYRVKKEWRDKDREDRIYLVCV